jgi:hypothetical protein
LARPGFAAARTVRWINVDAGQDDIRSAQPKRGTPVPTGTVPLRI